VGLEPGIDVAVLRILDIPDERDLPDSEKTIIPCVLGDSDLVQIGEYSVAMGSPGISDAIGTDRDDPWGGLLAKQTATDGSVLGRDSPIEFGIGIWAQQRRGDLGPQYGTNFDFAFRVATPINPGNSGGPLFNERGEVIGINFYGGSFMIMQNFNHSIPINLAKDFATQLLSTGKFIKPWLGLDIIMPQTIGTAEQYDEFKQLHAPAEITVFGVRKRSPAEQAGFKKGDVIAMVDGIEFPDAEALRLYVFKQPVGKMLEVTVKRNGRKLADPLMVEVGPKRRFDAEFSV
jgi:S1-C subfamily serine protease